MFSVGLVVRTVVVLGIVSTTANATNVVDDQEFTCGIWFAKSTIPGAGLGIFAGKDFDKGESVLPVGDVVIPLVDSKIHKHRDYKFLWDEYTWEGVALFMEREGVSESISVVSPGFGSAVNCFLGLVNVKETIPSNTNTGLHRSQDPGVGAFSTYWNRETLAMIPIKAGNELFADYGNGWFTSREETIGPVPLKGDLVRANELIEKYLNLEQSLKSVVKGEILEELWETFAWKTPFEDTSRVLFAMPKNWDDLRVAGNITLTELKRRHHSTSLDWLKQHGECGDLITVKESTIRQAGRGAFARKRFTVGEIVAPYPLIHLPYRQVLDMFELTRSDDPKKHKADRDRKTQTQLLENYCMGHNESTLLLCPYGTLSSHINHNQTLANVKMVWADPAKSNHHADWLNKTLRELYDTPYAGLAMSLVATREIEANEEIFLDYGDEWEEAWQTHVKSYVPVSGASTYKSAEQLNDEMTVIRTEFELIFHPYPSNVQVYFSLAFSVPRIVWLKYWEQGTLDEFMIKEDEYYGRVEVLRREVDRYGDTWYTVLPLDDGSKKKLPLKPKIIERVPREAFRFFDNSYTSDMLQRNAFRHDARIPDHLFPDLWRNRRSGVDLDPLSK
ncbi:hypothetical protein MHU86_1217 [Fragilaria crotonensis]|nr:hypothetical protein MHU86_1217 [Fragilaria crotonensis]